MESTTDNRYSANVIHGAYYPHIDGIRALAVIPVVLFHALSSLCPGGFTGVDVFFVISGYLITGGILRDLEKDQFTIRNFYHRRIRRIMPAYFTLIASVFAIGCTVYYSIPLVQLGNASAMGTLFSANLYFSNTSWDYFAPDIHSNALLHLWSLSVEEQFYLFIPLLCAFIWKIRRRMLLSVFSAIALVSLILAICAVAKGDRNEAFYLLHFRAWELLSGSILAMLPLPSQAGRGGYSRRYAVAAALGLLLVILPDLALSSKTPFPGAAALPSIAGTAMLIRYGQAGWVSRLLSSRVLVGTGKISYSLYLWHWPVIVFWRYLVYEQLRFYDYAGIILLSFLMGFLSWRFVELPVRTSLRWTPRRSFAFAAGGIVLLVAAGVACDRRSGWSSLHPRANAIVAKMNHHQYLKPMIQDKLQRLRTLFSVHTLAKPPYPSLQDGARDHLGVPGHPEIFLIGDSHAARLRHGLDLALREAGRIGMLGVRLGAMPFAEQTGARGSLLAELQTQPELSSLVLAQYWSHHLQNSPLMFSQLEAFALRMQSGRRNLYIVTDVPVYDTLPIIIAAKREIIGLRRIDPFWCGRQTASEYERRQGEINRRLATICARTGAVLIPLHLAFKEGDHYISDETVLGNTIPMYTDNHHLSQEGSLRAARFMMPYLHPKPEAADIKP